jgi:hypothetical protein
VEIGAFFVWVRFHTTIQMWAGSPVVNIDTLAVGPVQAGSTPSFTSPSSLVEIRVLATVRGVNSRGAFELTPPARIGINVDALPSSVYK